MRYFIISISFVLAASGPLSAQEAIDTGLGTVVFPNSCSEEVQDELHKGLAQLHHMDYWTAEATFKRVIDRQSDCAMAYWGAAMTFFHPLWHDAIGPEKLREGRELVQKAKYVKNITEREKAYIEAVWSFYKSEDADQGKRILATAKAYKKLAGKYSDDPEAQLFYALFHIAPGVAPQGDETHKHQLEAGAIAEKVLQAYPNHPGAHHYLIHAYDHPALAEKAIKVAHSYGKVAPNTTHALHMGSHIFTRRGYWKEAIEWDSKALQTAQKSGPLNAYYLHSADYASYAYLQIAKDEKIKALIDEFAEYDGLVSDPQNPLWDNPASAFTLAAVPARFTLERREWAEAARLQTRMQKKVAWDKYPWAEVNLHFARALGAARSGDLSSAREAVKTLTALRDKIQGFWRNYWVPRTEVLIKTAQAWIAYTEGDADEALELQKEAADLDEKLGIHPISPGRVLPARELLGDLLIELERPGQALPEYEKVLEIRPNRLNALFGAGYAAELSRDMKQAKSYFKRLAEQCAGADDLGRQRQRLQHMRDFFAGRQ